MKDLGRCGEAHAAACSYGLGHGGFGARGSEAPDLVGGDVAETGIGLVVNGCTDCSPISCAACEFGEGGCKGQLRPRWSLGGGVYTMSRL
jgi:hypothetical protein